MVKKSYGWSCGKCSRIRIDFSPSGLFKFVYLEICGKECVECLRSKNNCENKDECLGTVMNIIKVSLKNEEYYQQSLLNVFVSEDTKLLNWWVRLKEIHGDTENLEELKKVLRTNYPRI